MQKLYIPILKKVFIISIILFFTISAQANLDEKINKKKTIQNIDNTTKVNLVSNINKELLYYRITKVEEEVKNLVSENKDTSIKNKLDLKYEKIKTKLITQQDTYNKVLDSTKESYTFLSNIMMSLMGFILIIFAGIYYVISSAFPKWLKEKVESILDNMSKDGFSSKIEDWLSKELDNLNTQFNDLKSEYDKDEDLSTIIKKDLSNEKKTENHEEIKDLLVSGDMNGAKEKIDNVLAKDPSDQNIKILFGQYYLLNGDYNLAFQNLELADKSIPNNFCIHHLLGLTSYAMNSEEDTIIYLKNACLFKSNFSFDYIYLGKYFLKKKNIIQANHYFDQATSLFPNEIKNYIYLGKIYCKTGNIGNAKEMLEKIKYLVDKK